MRWSTRVAHLLHRLTVAEKAALTAGHGWWGTTTVERLGIPAVGMSDGPNGVRGPTISSLGIQSVCLPCGTALAATWDPALLERVGALLARQLRERGCRILLAPTINIIRSPFAGRNFETFGEDPLLAGTLAAAYVRGVQGGGCVATLKHFVGNEAEHERYVSNSVIDERALREIYLRPFEIAVREGGAAAVMTSYNRVNGEWPANNHRLLTAILRDEWGFDGIVMTDWFGVADTRRAAAAGLDLEMPGPARNLGRRLAAAVDDGLVAEADLDTAAGHLLSLIERLDLLGAPPARVEHPLADRPEDRAVAADAAAASAVLLRNEGILPLDPASIRSLAVIGPNAARAQIMGGGSARLTPFPAATPVEALRAGLPGVQIRSARGCDIDRATPPLAVRLAVEVYAVSGFDGEPVATLACPDGVIRWMEQPPGTAPGEPFCYRATGTLDVEEPGGHRFSLAQATPSRLRVNGNVVLDGAAHPPPPGGTDFFGLASQQMTATVVLSPGPAEIVVEGFSDGRSALPGLSVFGTSIGHRVPLGDDPLGDAARLAGACDVAVVVVGTTDEWEHEFADRATIHLPGEQDELIRRVCAANDRTIVVVNAAGPVLMDWADLPAATLVTWFGGQEMAPALTDVLLGRREPGGRMPFTVPRRAEHDPARGNFPGENGEVRYGESIFVGYRGYEHRALPVRYPFGFGLGYTTFDIGPPVLSVDTVTARSLAHHPVRVSVAVTNTGTRTGSEVVQVYVAPPPGPLARPAQELKGFAKVTLAPGERGEVTIDLDDRAFAAYEPGQPDYAALEPVIGDVAWMIGGGRPLPRRRAPGWVIEPGTYEIRVGRSCADITGVVPLVISAAPSA